MTLHRVPSILLILLFGLTLIGISPADAQKKAKPKAKAPTAQPQPAQTQEEEQQSDEPAVADQPAPAQEVSGLMTGGILDVLKKFQGRKTNLGVLKKVTRDYIELEDENSVLTVPVSSVHSLRQVRDTDEEDKPIVHLEIRLISKD